ncbi:MAG: hypothetical protein IPL47_10635 [Phyllobacteriaceae bacterium]|nr:hypothetical protein [Phyllobacteriaceae bacterium]
MSILGNELTTQTFQPFQAEQEALQNIKIFNQNILEYRKCVIGEDYEEIFRLRYKSYHGNDLIPSNSSGMLFDKYDELSNAFHFAVYYGGNLVSTLRLHIVFSSKPVSPTYDLFRDVLEERVSRGETFVDPTRFAADPEWSASLRFLPQVTLRLAVAACSYFNVTSCLTMVREEHAGFYKRYFHVDRIADPRAQPNALASCALFGSRCDINMIKTTQKYPVFRSTPLEQRQLFAKPVGQVGVALNVIPQLEVELKQA